MNILRGSFLLFSLLFSNLYAQESIIKRSQTKVVHNVPIEKVYLFLDRSQYATGEDIWFKAYLIEAFSNRLFDNSNCLYVEFIAPNSKIIQRNSIHLEKGLGNGDFHIKDSIPSGTYRVRAYTNWMRNFGEVFFFEKEIKIENPMDNNPLDKPIRNTLPPDIQFFPEGGALIQNVFTLIAFKAINNSGLGIGIKGSIFNSDGDSITSFESSHLGMGSFNFISKNGFSYYAAGVDQNGTPFKLALPTSVKTGFAMKISDKDNDKLRVNIKTNSETFSSCKNQKIIIAGISRGNLCVTAQSKISGMINNIILPKNAFPVGVARITLLDTTGTPLCERLIYISEKNKILTHITPDNKTYDSRQKVTLHISVKDSANNPVAANLSLSVTDGNFQNAKNQSNILSYSLLESEIKGYIEQPAWYFDTTKTNHIKELDNLLLTQGWRDFIWKKIADSAVTLNYFVEKGICISGRLQRLWVNKPIPNANISMGLMGGDTPQLNFAKTDSTGSYYFDGMNFTGQRTLIISASNKNHRNQGLISLDSLFGKPAPINALHLFNANAEPVFVKEAERRYNILKKFKLSDTIQLNEVLVKGRKSNKNTDDGKFRIYGWPDYSIEVTDKMVGYMDIFQLLQGRVAGLMITGTYPNITFSSRGSSGEPLFLLDGMPVELDVIATISITDVDKVEVLKSGAGAAIFGSRGGNGIISVFTKHGFISSTKKVFHSINQKINGFYAARTFYSPNYEIKNPEHKKPDLRATIYWQANIVTDSIGNATVSFFNSDTKTPVKINIEGITDDGVPLVGESGYTIKN